MTPLSPEELRSKLEAGEVALGCPLPEGFKGMTEQDRAVLAEALKEIVRVEKGVV